MANQMSLGEFGAWSSPNLCILDFGNTGTGSRHGNIKFTTSDCIMEVMVFNGSLRYRSGDYQETRKLSFCEQTATLVHCLLASCLHQFIFSENKQKAGGISQMAVF